MHIYFHAGESCSPPVVYGACASLEAQVYYIVNNLLFTLISCTDVDFILLKLLNVIKHSHIVLAHIVTTHMATNMQFAEQFTTLLTLHVKYAAQYSTAVKQQACTKQIQTAWRRNSKQLAKLIPQLDVSLVHAHVKLVQQSCVHRHARKIQKESHVWEQNEKLVQDIVHQIKQYIITCVV